MSFENKVTTFERFAQDFQLTKEETSILEKVVMFIEMRMGGFRDFHMDMLMKPQTRKTLFQEITNMNTYKEYYSSNAN